MAIFSGMLPMIHQLVPDFAGCIHLLANRTDDLCNRRIKRQDFGFTIGSRANFHLTFSGKTFTESNSIRDAD
jgi:hypothetical protein